jgi:hypothetical protein
MTSLPLIVSLIVVATLALLGLVGYLIDRAADRSDQP